MIYLISLELIFWGARATILNVLAKKTISERQRSLSQNRWNVVGLFCQKILWYVPPRAGHHGIVHRTALFGFLQVIFLGRFVELLRRGAHQKQQKTGLRPP